MGQNKSLYHLTGCNENTASFFDIPTKDDEEDQNMPPQNMLFWQKHYFKMKATENQQIQEGFFALHFICLKPSKISFEKGVCTRERKPTMNLQSLCRPY